MQIELSDAQAELLVQVLRNRLGDYSMQIADANTPDFRDRLRQEREELQKIVDQLPAE